jgi:M6 family metalloprotease-like protein
VELRKAYPLLCVPLAVAALAGIDSTRAAWQGTRTDSAAACSPPFLGSGVGEGRNDPAQFPASVGALRTVMLFVDFADARGTVEPRALYEEYVPRAIEWYRDVSYGRLQLVVTPLFRRLTLRGNIADYRPPGGGFGLVRAAIEEAVAAADRDVDFNGVQGVYLVLPFEAIEAIGSIGVLLLTEPLRVDGTEIRIRTVLFDRSLGGEAPHYLAHETGHMLGLPHVSGHSWDIMSSSVRPRGLFAWHRWKLGWLDPTQIACLAGRRRVEAALTPLERPGGTKAIILRRGPSAYVAEVRGPVAGRGGGLCKGGVVIYEVDFSPPTGWPQIRLSPARIETSAQRARCGPQSWAPFGRGRGEISRLTRWGLRFDVLSALSDGSFRVRVTKAR